MANMMRACLTLGALYFFHFFVTSQAACQSFGVDYVDGGGPYFVNTGSPDFFSFTNIFEGGYLRHETNRMTANML